MFNFNAVREPARLKAPLNNAVWTFAVLVTLLFWFGYDLASRFIFRNFRFESPVIFNIALALVGAALWVATFALLKKMLHTRAFDLYWALCAVAVAYNTGLGFISREGEQGWVISTVANMDYAVLVALLGLAYRKYNFVKVIGLVGFILALSLLRHFAFQALPLTSWWFFAFNFLFWLGFSYAFLSEIDAIDKSRRGA